MWPPAGATITGKLISVPRTVVAMCEAAPRFMAQIGELSQRRVLSERIAERVDGEVKRFLDEAYTVAMKALEGNRGLLERIAELVRAKRIEGISDLRDESDRHGMRMIIELSRSATYASAVKKPQARAS